MYTSCGNTSLLGPETKKAVHLSSGHLPLAHFPLWIQALLGVKAAAAQANARAGLLSATDMGAITSTCDTLQKACLDQDMRQQLFPVGTTLGGGSIGIHLNISEAIARHAFHLEPTSAPQEWQNALKKINLNQSTADVCFTGGRIALVRSLSFWTDTFKKQIAQFETRIETFKNHHMVARTCLRDAGTTSSFGFFAAWSSALERQLENISHIVPDLLQINLGGTVIGDSRGADPRYLEVVLACLAEQTQLPVTRRRSLQDAAQFCDDLGRFGGALQVCARTLQKMAQDIRLLFSGPEHGLGAVKIPEVLQSSAFFGREKINPIIPESMIQAACQVNHYCSLAGEGVSLGELQLNVFESMVLAHLFLSVDLLQFHSDKFMTECLLKMELTSQ